MKPGPIGSGFDVLGGTIPGDYTANGVHIILWNQRIFEKRVKSFFADQQPWIRRRPARHRTRGGPTRSDFILACQCLSDLIAPRPSLGCAALRSRDDKRKQGAG